MVLCFAVRGCGCLMNTLVETASPDVLAPGRGVACDRLPAELEYVEQEEDLVFEETAHRPLHCSIGPLTSQTLRENDLSVDLEASESSLDSIVEALSDRLSKEAP